MSRPISYTSAVTVNVTTYSGATNYVSTGTSYPPSNGLNSSANTSSYAAFSATSSNSGFAYYLFSITVPANATINSVACTARGRASASSSGTSSFQLFAGSTGKGNQTTFTTTTASAMNLTTGSWTAAEINSGVALRIGTRKASSSTSRYSTRFYGATLTVNYSVDGTAYEITAESTYTGATVSPATQEVMEGGSATVAIYPDDINNIVVEDRGVDVTGDLHYVIPPVPQPISAVPASFDSTNTSVTGSNTNNGCAAETTTTTATFTATSTAGSTTSIYYSFAPITLPENATITSITCRYRASWPGGSGTNNAGTQYFSSRKSYLCYGTTKKGNGMTISNTTSSQSTIDNLTDTGTWSKNELSNIKLLLEGIHQTGNTQQVTVTFWGATLNVTYTVPQDPYYTYTLSNISADHSILISESIVVPPEEDPTKTYYSLTISSINSTTDPGRGTTRVESGTGQTITITPSDPQLTLALDNGVDVSSQLVAHGTAAPTSAVTTVQGASYGFTLNSSTGYYVSNNAGVDKSAALCKVDFDLPVSCLVTIQFINYAEATYDFGIFGNIDVPLSTNYYAAGSGGATITDNSYKLACNTSTYNTSTPQTITYEIAAGQHSIYIKYSKDDATASNNDTLQFKVTNIETLEPSVGYYTYDLSNISADHSLVFIFGNVTYYFVTSSTDSNAKLYPDGQMVELPGETYKLTVVPENSGDTITVRDNNVDVTSSLERKEVVVEKGGQQVTVVNYIYHINNVQTGHTVVVYSASAGDTPYVKVNGTWTRLSAIYKKENGTWVEQTPDIDIFDDGEVYVRN